ncbi:hypothetical protein SAB1901c [Staphylococcus aureus RF122]|nr:hypothetical protein SAB1901c [Staphylococcus aureus RF122]
MAPNKILRFYTRYSSLKWLRYRTLKKYKTLILSYFMALKIIRLYKGISFSNLKVYRL